LTRQDFIITSVSYKFDVAAT